ncbi:GNAT family N-acetyltransferase [Endozoicomonas numazuensis]|uniref:GNAT family N-acetyltransferase n=1 Tax=Endozoicomonas numazuensis TaxID=1137799 RepID=UPI000B159C7D|nr:GNAT family N-acetyltransferase [Endozoicomonas numazuensis]
MQFRKDAWQVSHGHLEGFSASETREWFQFLAEKAPEGFLMVLYQGEIIGQLEFRSRLQADSGKIEGYINLFYLVPHWRGKGMGQKLHDYTLSQLANNSCTQAFLRYIPGNHRAEAFYLKNGWAKEGEPTEQRGQLMKKDLAPSRYYKLQAL